MKTIYIIGFMGSGKSSVGHELAKSLNKSYIDTDDYVEEKHGKISEIFQEKGEKTFRLYEIDALKETSNFKVVSTGGGIVEKQENFKTMKKNGIIFYLHTSFEEIANRLGQDVNRPLWNKAVEDQVNLYNRRIPIYKEFSDYMIDTDQKSIQDVVNEIIHIVKSIK